MTRQQTHDDPGAPPAGAGEALGAGFGIGVMALAALHVLAAVLDLVLPSPGSRPAQAATAATAAALLASIAVWHRMRGLPLPVVPHAAGIVVTVAGVSSGLHLGVSPNRGRQVAGRCGRVPYCCP